MCLDFSRGLFWYTSGVLSCCFPLAKCPCVTPMLLLTFIAGLLGKPLGTPRCFLQQPDPKSVYATTESLSDRPNNVWSQMRCSFPEEERKSGVRRQGEFTLHLRELHWIMHRAPRPCGEAWKTSEFTSINQWSFQRRKPKLTRGSEETEMARLDIRGTDVAGAAIVVRDLITFPIKTWESGQVEGWNSVSWCPG